LESIDDETNRRTLRRREEEQGKRTRAFGSESEGWKVAVEASTESPKREEKGVGEPNLLERECETEEGGSSSV
jgi:hypothetical protein